jgi:hypothetical protein
MVAGCWFVVQLLRTLADQVRKRERLKKQLHKLYRAEMASKVSVGRIAAVPAHGCFAIVGAGNDRLEKIRGWTRVVCYLRG